MNKTGSMIKKYDTVIVLDLMIEQKVPERQSRKDRKQVSQKLRFLNRFPITVRCGSFSLHYSGLQWAENIFYSLYCMTEITIATEQNISIAYNSQTVES